MLAKLRTAGRSSSAPGVPVAAGDYVAGPSHCLPTNTTARFSSGISVYEFLTRSSVERYTKEGIAADAPAIEPWQTPKDSTRTRPVRRCT